MSENISALPSPEPNSGDAPLTGEIPVCGLLVVDAARRIVIADPGAELLLGATAGELTGQPLRVLPAPLGAAIARVVASGEAARHEVIEFAPPGQSLRTVSLNLLPIEGNFVAATLLDLRSISELEANTARLERLASIGTLSAGMAHEIKNALVAVRTFAELLLQQDRTNELADLATREIKRIDAIVSQMLRFGALGRPTFARLGLNDIVAHTGRLVQHQLKERRVTLQSRLLAEPDRVTGDAYQLQQVMLNLFFNALDAMPDGGELAVTTELVPLPPSASSGSPDLHSCVRVTVGDTGAGIAPENVARLFETFFTTKPKGTGLGLPITRRIVKDHGGTISVESTPGRGTTFTLLFPAASPPTA